MVFGEDIRNLRRRRQPGRQGGFAVDTAKPEYDMWKSLLLAGDGDGNISTTTKILVGDNSIPRRETGPAMAYRQQQEETHP
ncbi:hypothetical protein V491_08780 [Pseudogymnoascus sp. VKM F-3775]|nr:hypothetical protein V491_08780 [Pseudogymnoascus sp. VKM F-3775]